MKFFLFFYRFMIFGFPLYSCFHLNSIEKQQNKNSCSLTKVVPRLIGGLPIKQQTSVPYMAAIGNRVRNKKVWFCGGSLISRKMVLTAAHCLANTNPELVRLGTTSLDDDYHSYDYQISKNYIHYGYRFPETYDDIGLVELATNVDFNESIRPICLPEDDVDDYREESAYVLGWGAKGPGGEATKNLNQVKVTVFTNTRCDRSYSNSSLAPKSFPVGIKNSQLCAGDENGGKDACQGDSGGPLVITNVDMEMIKVIGIVSSGSGCGFKAYPGVYVRVSSYLSWIKRYV